MLQSAAYLKTGLVSCTQSTTAVLVKPKSLIEGNESKGRIYKNFKIQTACFYAA
ncbi:MAG TPA: hypothetical protein V6D48_10305 [Oculatellaceae cyanobacterium]